MTTRANLPQRWDLDVFFPGGSNSESFKCHINILDNNIIDLYKKLQEIEAKKTPDVVNMWDTLLQSLQSFADRMQQASAFTSCLVAQDMQDEVAKLLSGRVRKLVGDYAAIKNKLQELISRVPQAEWESLMANPTLAPLAFPLHEMRQQAEEKLPVEQEILAIDLSVSGYHAWNDLYSMIVGRMTIPFEQDGNKIDLSVGQAMNMLLHQDRSVREALFLNWEAAWQQEAPLIAHALNHMAGYRLTLYRHRRWDSFLKEPVTHLSRMSEVTLNAMWTAINQAKERLVEYLNRKAEMLGVERLSWHDLQVSIGTSETKISYDEAAQFIVDNFRKFSPKLAAFAERAVSQGWVEAEDRPGKRPGGFCTHFPVHQQSRIFMTYGGTMGNVTTLAHELGHAYHNYVTEDLPPLTTTFGMNVAETASTFAEIIVTDAAVQLVTSEEERLFLLEDSLQRSVTFLLNIESRFLFETAFYERRKQGLVSVAELNELMVHAQKEAYLDALSEYHPHFWASKLHFHSTSVPFYNFPYTFGYLFSLSLFARAQAEGTSFERKYIDLLRDTGRMTVEQLAMQHLDADVTKPTFWKRAVDVILADVDEFMKLTEKK